MAYIWGLSRWKMIFIQTKLLNFNKNWKDYYYERSEKTSNKILMLLSQWKKVILPNY